MKALIFNGPGNVTIESRPQPEAGQNQVLMKPLYAGLCFSDKHMYDGSMRESHVEDPTYMRGRGRGSGPFRPGVFGHEFSGEVAALGPGATGVEVGDRVTVNPFLRCGQCLMCRAGLATMCMSVGGCLGGGSGDGGLAEWTVVEDYMCHRVPSAVTDWAAAVVEPTAVGRRTVWNCGMRIGDNTVFLGAEDYNNSAMMWARAGGANKIVTFDPIEKRRAAAKALGAHATFDPTEVDVVATPRSEMPFGADIVFVSMEDYIPGSQQYLHQACDIVRVGGTVALSRAYGYQEAFTCFNPLTLLHKEIRLTSGGNHYGEEGWRGGRDRGDYQITIDGFADGRLDASKYQATIVPFDDLRTKSDVDEIYRSLPASANKVGFRIWGTSE